MHDGRLHPVRGHHDIGERQQTALPPKPLCRLGQAKPMFTQICPHNAGGKANENQAAERTKGQDQLPQYADAIECVDAHAAFYGEARPAFVIPIIKRQQKIKLLGKPPQNRKYYE